jgi:hypothetical protein
MGDLVKEVINKLYPWTFHLIGGLLVIGFGVFLWFTFWGVHKYTNAFVKILGRDDRIKELQDTIEKEKETREIKSLIADQVTTALFNVRSFVDTLNSIRLEQNPSEKAREALRLIQRILDQLSNDVKIRGGAQHRCGIWVVSNDQKTLTLQFTSFGFPRHYKGNRTLEINDSLAGKTFLKKQKLNISDVKADKDWKPSPYTEVVRYKSLICIPLSGFGVLTIDGEEPMSEECELIGEVYASLIESAVIEHDEGYSELNFQRFLAEGIENEEEVG